MTKPQRYAIDHPCRLVGEMAHPRFVRSLSAERVTGIITVNSGYEGIEQTYSGPVWRCLRNMFGLVPRDVVEEKRK